MCTRTNGADAMCVLMAAYDERMEERVELRGRLRAIGREAEAELERIERHGGCTRFAECVLALAKVD